MIAARESCLSPARIGCTASRAFPLNLTLKTHTLHKFGLWTGCRCRQRHLQPVCFVRSSPLAGGSHLRVHGEAAEHRLKVGGRAEVATAARSLAHRRIVRTGEGHAACDAKQVKRNGK